MNHAALHTESSSILSLSPPPITNYGDAIYSASSAILAMFVAGKPCDRHILSQIMCEAFGGTDAEGLWHWKDAYEAVEVALVRFVQQYSPALTKNLLLFNLLFFCFARLIRV
jgi:hypothetical protein